ncbi:MAG TPA: FAD-dependent oxidoreductase [Woeseiaceae bacterium]|nr:FAD-dependent oxidoreductase [Woeseiaceae bacterium]
MPEQTATHVATAPAPERLADMFPVLTAVQLDEIRAFGTEREFPAGAMLWNVGDRNVDFHVVLDGTLQIVRRDAFGRETVLFDEGPGQFSGDIVALSGRARRVAGRAGSALSVIAISPERLKELIVTHARLGEIIMRSFVLRRVRLIADHASDLLVVGSRYSGATQQLQDFLTRNAQPYTFLDLDSDDALPEMLGRLDFSCDDVPLLITSAGEPLRNPALRTVAERIGISEQLDECHVHDVAVVGAGPSGLACAVYAASEGLDTVVFDSVAPGGQAGTSSKIENYLGFPTGISGQALAGRAYVQAQKFGARVEIPACLKELACGNPYHVLTLDNGDTVRARSVVIAAGARYRKPPLENLERFEGVGVHYGATFLEARLCRDEEVVIIGGGNSAGQAAVFLAETAAQVRILVRGEGLAESMSQYLIRRIETTPNIELLPYTEVMALGGDRELESVRWRDRLTGSETERPVRHLFVFIGATPNTEFLPEAVVTDAKGFVCTGPEIESSGNGHRWPLTRAPYLLETSCPGVFAAGDVRATSTKRVASAVGEGSVAVQFIHAFLASRGG